MKKLLLFICLFILSAISSFPQDSARGVILMTNKADSIGITYAIVVGISSYANINHLLYADDDAQLFSEFLINEKICEKKNVVKLIDSIATTANFYKELTKLKNKVVPNDRVFIYFAGHGDVETDLESGFLLTYNCEANNYPATSIDISMLEKYVNAFVNKNAKVVLITDACRSGNLAGGLIGPSTTMNALNKSFQNTIKILSCQPNQLSVEKHYPGGGHGVFTYHLVEGLSGFADTDDDSSICLREIALHLDKVRTETNKKQVPKVDGDPDKTIVHFDKSTKMALLAKKQNINDVAVNTAETKRGVEDTTWTTNKYYQRFKELIREGRYIELRDEVPGPGSSKNSADFMITEAAKNKQPAGLIEDMKLELSAVLEDEAQKWINRYLRGEFANQSYIVLNQLENVKQYLETVESVIGENDFRYNEIHVKKLFFDAYIVWKKRDSALYLNALRELERANSILPNQSWIYCLNGILESELKKFRESEQSFKTSIKLAPTWSYPKNNLGLLYIKLRKYTEAEDAFNKAIQIDSNYAYLWNNLGTLYFVTRKTEKAETAFNKAIQMDANYPEPLNNLGKLFKDLKKYKEAEIVLKKAIQLNPYYALAWYNLGTVYRALKKADAARKAFRRAFEIDPKLPVSEDLLISHESMVEG